MNLAHLTQPALAWWKGRSLREQRLLLLMAALFVGVVFWFGLWRPLHAALSDARERHGRAVIALAETKGRAEAVKRLDGLQLPELPGGLQAFVTASANEAGFTAARIEPDGEGQVRATIDAARPQAAFAWVAALEQSHGLVVESFSGRANTDATLAVEFVLRERGR